MRRASCLACLVFSGLLAFTTMAADPPSRPSGKREFPLKYRLSRYQEIHISGQYGRASTTKIEFADEPKYLSKEPLYATVNLGVKKDPFHVVFDNSDNENRRYDILYVDANRDGRIGESEKWTAARNQGWMYGSSFGPVKLMVSCCEDEYCPQWFTFQLNERENRIAEDNIFRPRLMRNFMVNNTGYYQGIVTFGDQRRLVAFVDNDGDGLYNKYLKGLNTQSDRLIVDYNNDGHLDAGEEAQPLGRYVQVGDSYWQLDVIADGSAVTVESVNKPLATVRSQVRDFNVLLSSEDAVFRVLSHDGTAKVPAGKYRLMSANYQIEKAGQKWDFQASVEEAVAVIDAPPDGDARLVFGPPLIPKVTNFGSGRQLLLNLELKGAGGEVYQNVSLPNAQKPPVPQVRILDENDRELALLDFHYG